MEIETRSFTMKDNILKIKINRIIKKKLKKKLKLRYLKNYTNIKNNIKYMKIYL
jgi:hypothetical protein